MTNSTVSGNASEGVRFRGDVLRVVHATITANLGGGLKGAAPGTDGVHLANAIVAGNVTADLVDVLLDAASANNLIGGDPKLGPLADNGGPTWTHKPMPGSPALGAGSNAAAVLDGLTTDQRGRPRFSGAVDLGAVEVQAPSVKSVDLGTGGPQRSSVKGPFTVTLGAGDGSVAVPPGSAFELVRVSDGVGFPLTMAGTSTTGGGVVEVKLALAGAGLESGSLPDGRYTLTVHGAEVGDPTYGLAMASDHVTSFHRFFGDGNGDGLVDSRDVLAFRSAYLGGMVTASNWFFDVDGDGLFTMADLQALNDRFRKRRLT
ncbi:MAG: choice-of-anchor Q domain-containing protein [Isosphaeraceae bacterium]